MNEESPLLQSLTLLAPSGGYAYVLAEYAPGAWVPVLCEDAPIFKEWPYYLIHYKTAPLSGILTSQTSIPQLLDSGRLEVLLFQDAAAIHREVLEVGDSQFKIVRCAPTAFEHCPIRPNEYFLPLLKSALDKWRSDQTHFSFEGNPSGNSICREATITKLGKRLIELLGDHNSHPPYFPLLNFRVQLTAPGETLAFSQTACNPLAFTREILDTYDGEWPWIAEMPNHVGQTIFIPDTYSEAHSKIENPLFREILLKLKDEVELIASHGPWKFFTRRNVLLSAERAQTPSIEPPQLASTFKAIAHCLGVRSQGADEYLCTVWAQNIETGVFLPIGCHVQPDQLVELQLVIDVDSINHATIYKETHSIAGYQLKLIGQRNIKHSKESLDKAVCSLLPHVKEAILKLDPIAAIEARRKDFQQWLETCKTLSAPYFVEWHDIGDWKIEAEKTPDLYATKLGQLRDSLRLQFDEIGKEFHVSTPGDEHGLDVWWIGVAKSLSGGCLSLLLIQWLAGADKTCWICGDRHCLNLTDQARFMLGLYCLRKHIHGSTTEPFAAERVVHFPDYSVLLRLKQCLAKGADRIELLAAAEVDPEIRTRC